MLPFGTAWMGETTFSTWPVVIYGCILILAAIAYFLLVQALLGCNGRDSDLDRALGNGFKEKISMVIYAIAIGLAFVHPWPACALYAIVAMMWFIPDQRIEQLFK